MTSGSHPLLIAGGYSSEVHFLDALCGDVRRTLALQDYGHVNRLAVSPGVQSLAIVGNPHVRTFEIEGSQSSDPLCTYEGHKNNVSAVGYDVMGRWLYTSSEDGTIRVWDCRSQKCELCYENVGVFEKIAIHSVDLHPNQVELIAGDGQGKVLVWDLTANQLRRTLIPEEGVPVRSVCIAPDAKVIAAANHEGTCYFWLLADDSFDPLQKIDAHSSYVLKCLFSPEAKHLATTSADSTTNLWHSHTDCFSKCSTLQGHATWVWDCAFSSDGQYLVTGSSDCTCRLWDVRSGTQRLEFSSFQKGVTAVALVDALDKLR